MNWAEVIVIVNSITVICAPIISYFAVRSQMAKAGQEIQDRLQKMMEDENDLLTTRLKRCEAEYKQQGAQIALVKEMLKKMNKIELEIDGTMVILRDSSGTPHVARIKEE